jgi:hypothetical protein
MHADTISFIALLLPLLAAVTPALAAVSIEWMQVGDVQSTTAEVRVALNEDARGVAVSLYYKLSCAASAGVATPTLLCSTSGIPDSAGLLCRASLPVETQAVTGAAQRCTLSVRTDSADAAPEKQSSFIVPALTSAPASAQMRRACFVYTGDATNKLPGVPLSGLTEGFTAFDAQVSYALAHNCTFALMLGDTVYQDTPPAATTLDEYFDTYLQQFAAEPVYGTLFAELAQMTVWDDHEVSDDWTADTVNPTLYTYGHASFLGAQPALPDADLPLLPVPGPECIGAPLFTVRDHGAYVRVITLDAHSCLTASAAAVCNNDLAPLSSTAMRDALYALGGTVPAPPVPAGCLEAIADPARTIVGASQMAALLDALDEASADNRIIFIVTPAPISEQVPFWYTNWNSYSAERSTLLTYLRNAHESSRLSLNTHFLTTDVHAARISPVYSETQRERAAASPTPALPVVAWEFITGPVRAVADVFFLQQTFGGAQGAVNATAIAEQYGSYLYSQPAGTHWMAVDYDIDACRLTVTSYDPNVVPTLDIVSGAPITLTLPLYGIGGACPLPERNHTGRDTLCGLQCGAVEQAACNDDDDGWTALAKWYVHVYGLPPKSDAEDCVGAPQHDVRDFLQSYCVVGSILSPNARAQRDAYLAAFAQCTAPWLPCEQ